MACVSWCVRMMTNRFVRKILDRVIRNPRQTIGHRPPLRFENAQAGVMTTAERSFPHASSRDDAGTRPRKRLDRRTFRRAAMLRRIEINDRATEGIRHDEAGRFTKMRRNDRLEAVRAFHRHGNEDCIFVCIHKFYTFAGNSSIACPKSRPATQRG